VGGQSLPAATGGPQQAQPSCIRESLDLNIPFLLFSNEQLSNEVENSAPSAGSAELVSGGEGPLPGGDGEVLCLLWGAPPPHIHLIFTLPSDPITNAVNTVKTLLLGRRWVGDLLHQVRFTFRRNAKVLNKPQPHSPIAFVLPAMSMLGLGTWGQVCLLGSAGYVLLGTCGW
jgi:hypothetical protein